jgi:glycerol kinase
VTFIPITVLLRFYVFKDQFGVSMYVLGIDQGTTGTFVGLMNDDGMTASKAYKTHGQIYPQPGWVEQDPLELWKNACELVNQVIGQGGIEAGEIVGIGIANQGESVMLWDKQSGKPVYNVLVWQDARTQAAVEVMAADRHAAQEVARRTGLKLDSYFSASKIRWLLDKIPEAQALLKDGRLACGTLDTWLIWKLTSGRAFVTDVSTASRTLLFNIHTLQWDESLLHLFQIPMEILPQVLHSTGEFGVVSHHDLRCQGVPIVASVVDQPAEMVGQGCLNAGQIKATYGTGCFINLNTAVNPVASGHGLLTLLAWQRGDAAMYGLDGGVFTAASTINWLKDNLQLFSSVEAVDDLCAEVNDSGGAMWIPAQIGLGAPYWERSMRGAWMGLDLTTKRAHLVRAVLEGIAANVAQIVQAMKDDAGLTIRSLRADGGLTNSQAMMQIQADLLGFPVEVAADLEATASGVCFLAARASGMWTSDEAIFERVKVARTYEPRISDDQRRAHLDKFERAIEQLSGAHTDIPKQPV